MSKDTKLLAEDSFFSCCFNNLHGGSLYFSQNGQCVQNRICSYKSKVSKYDFSGVHCFVDVSEKFPFQNKIIDTTISHSGDKNGRGTVYCINGAFDIASTNISYSNPYNYAFCDMQTLNANSSFQFSIFSNNSQAHSNPCSYFGSAIGSYPKLNISSCNFLNNRVGGYLIESSISLYATNCSFENNDMKYGTFRQEYGKAIFEKCYYDKTPTTFGSVITKENVSNKIDMELHYFSTYECFREYENSTINIKHNIIEIILCIAHFIFPL